MSVYIPVYRTAQGFGRRLTIWGVGLRGVWYTENFKSLSPKPLKPNPSKPLNPKPITRKPKIPKPMFWKPPPGCPDPFAVKRSSTGGANLRSASSAGPKGFGGLLTPILGLGFKLRVFGKYFGCVCGFAAHFAA